MKIVFEGHACFSLVGSKNILIDPFISDNPLINKSWEEYAPDYILVTHAHHDHLGDAIQIAKKCQAPLLTMVDLANQLPDVGIEKIAFNFGGLVELEQVKVKMVPAWHGSTYSDAAGHHYGGVACGYIIIMDGMCIYHAGDTCLFGDMQTVIARHKLDVALLPIGGFYTMGPEDAVVAAEWLKAKTVIPMHYDTFPVIKQDPQLFKKQVDANTESMCLVMKPGAAITL